MIVADLIRELQRYPQDLDVRFVEDPDKVNCWVDDIEVSLQGDTGYHSHGEIRLISNER